jgi:PAS domain S-box-containing protein
MKPKSLLNRKVQFALAAATLTLIAAGTISYRGLVVSGESDQWVRHTHEVLENLQNLLSAMQSVESSFCGMVITGDDHYFESYRTNGARAQQYERTVGKLTVDNPVQQRQLPSLERLAAQKIQFSDSVIRLRRTKGLQAAAEALGEGTGQRIMDESQALIREMQDEELRLLAQREADARRRLEQTKAALVLGTLLGLCTAALAAWRVQRDTGDRKQAETQLRSLTDRLSFANSVAKVGVWEYVPASNTFTWDATMREIYGFPPGGPMPYEEWASTLLPEDRARIEAILQAVVRENNQGPVVEFRITRADGALRNVSGTGRAVLGEHGEVTSVVGVNTDITVRKAAEERFLESEERFRILVEGVQDYAIFTLEPEGKVVSWNAGAERIKGYKADEIIGQNFSRFYLQEDIDQGKPEEELRIAAESGRSEIEHWRVRKDGSRFWANVVITAARDSSGRLLGFSEISRDISDRKETEAKYRGLLEAAPDAMVVVNQDGKIVLLNVQAEKHFGYHRDELVGQKVKNIIPEGFAERLIADGTRTAADALAQQIGTGIELVGRRKDGSEFPLEIMLSPLESTEGILVTAAIRDITDRKKSEERLVSTVAELKRSNDDLQQFASVASHDLQEPLRMVASYTQLLAKRYKGRLDADADEFIGYAVDGSHRMQGLIRDLLAYSRAGTNGKALHEISSEKALQAAIANLRSSIEVSGAVVTHDALPAITSDDSQLAQVFQNLIGNAIKYRSAEVPRIHLSATKNAGTEWIFSVRDNGLGIEPEYFERIFILFQRLHGQKEFEGSGIGLTICKKIVERLGGRIWVQSQPKQGSTFYFALPERNGKQ